MHDDYAENLARLTNHYAENLSAPIDYANRLRFLADEIENDAIQGLTSKDAGMVRDHLEAVGHAYYGVFARG